jgi:glyoxylase-like metal-dependent hydrolase (beta-lactamase superfamily II)
MVTQTKAEGLYARQLPLGPMKNFVYLLGASGAKEVAVVDPAWDVAAIRAALEEDGKRLSAVFLTHHHFDHLNGVPELLTHVDVPVYVQGAEIDFAEPVQKLGSAVRRVSPGAVVTVGPLEITCVHTPGHTPGSQCLHCRNALVSGDTVFVNACGRCDLGGGDPAQMFDSLHRVLGTLPATTVLYPGHDYGDVPVSTLGREREQNPYFRLSDLPGFLAHRNRPRG